MKKKVYKKPDPEERETGKIYKIKKIGAKTKKYGPGYYIGCFVRFTYRIILVAVTLAVLAVFALLYTLNTVAHGPSESVRNALVQSAMQASATKWVPGLFLSDEEVQAIIAAGEEKVVEEVDYDVPPLPVEQATDDVFHGDDPAQGPDISDGIEYRQISAGTFRAYVMIVQDPSKVFVGVSSDKFASARRGQRIYEAAEKYGAIAAINAGEFADPGGTGSGAQPIGITYSKGKLVWDDNKKRTFIGFDSNDRLVVSEGMTAERASELGIRDAVSFQNGNVLIVTENGVTKCFYAPENNGKAQRTAIGQTAEGKVILIVTDGRSASSIGATRDDIINLMIGYGAVTAGMLDGGSSSMMYYANYVSKFNIDENSLDEYQRLGLVNKYKAFTKPRYLPTFFMVEGTEG